MTERSNSSGARGPGIDWASLRIAKPCTVEWASMSGDERRRFCESCRKNVYDLTDLDRESAEAIIVAHEGSLCVRLYQRLDGTLVTGDCRSARPGLALVPRVAAKGLLALLSLGAVSLGAATIGSVTPETELAPEGTATRRVQDTILDLRVWLGIDPEPVSVMVGFIMAEPFDEFEVEEEALEEAKPPPATEEPSGE